MIWVLVGCELSLFVKMFIILNAVAKDIVDNVVEFGNTFTNSDDYQQLTFNERNQMMTGIIEIVRFQVKAKGLVTNFMRLKCEILEFLIG